MVDQGDDLPDYHGKALSLDEKESIIIKVVNLYPGRGKLLPCKGCNFRLYLLSQFLNRGAGLFYWYGLHHKHCDSRSNQITGVLDECSFPCQAAMV